VSQTVTVKTGYEPRNLQREIHNSLKRFSVLVCHRRFGKTVLSINSLVDAACRCTKESPRFGYVAPLYSQAKAIAWDYLKRYTLSIPQTRHNESELWAQLPNGARIRLFGADNPDALRGMYFDGVVLDEVAQMKPDVWGEIIRPALSDRQGWALFIGTPKGINLFSDLYFSGLKDASWFAGFYPASKTKIIPEEELAKARASMSESQYRQEFECDFTASTEDRLITLDVVIAATHRAYKEDSYGMAPKILGFDVARFGDDRSTLIYRQGCVAYGLRKFHGLDTMAFADTLASEITRNKPDAVMGDVVGIGAGVIDRLRQLGFSIMSVNAGTAAAAEDLYGNKRAEMWVLCRDWLSEIGMIPEDQELMADLTTPMYSYDVRNRYQIEKKADQKKRGLPSPDCAEALVHTFAYPVAPRTRHGHRGQARRLQTDYDLFAEGN
jgi:hypothetical protein